MNIKTNKEEYSLKKNINLILPHKIRKNIDEKFTYTSNLDSEVANRLKKKLSDTGIKKHLANVKSLVLELTQSCNLRCRYCVFGGDYKSRRQHAEEKKMNLDTACKSIDFFYEQLKSPLRQTLYNNISISFYGGEALLEFETLMESIKYAKSHRTYKEVKPTLYFTTNGVMLTPRIIEKAVAEDVVIDISLDGPKQEHDKFRVTKNSKGSWDAVMKNVKFIKTNFPVFYDKNVRFMVTLHPSHDIKKIEAFFLSNEDLFNEQNTTISYVIPLEKQSDTEKIDAMYSARKKQSTQIYNELNRGEWFYRMATFRRLNNFISLGTRILSNTDSFTGACFPGTRRLFVESEGNFHMCERINHNFPIGNIRAGYNLENIRKIWEDWTQVILKMKCWNCSHWHLCNFCIASYGGEGKVDVTEKDCERFRNTATEAIKNYLTFKEYEDEKNGNPHPNSFNSFLESM